jgi:hypothetical protein
VPLLQGRQLVCQAVGLVRGLNIAYADGKLSYLCHLVQKAAPQWEDHMSTLTLKGDQAEVRWTAGRLSGTLMLVRVMK